MSTHFNYFSLVIFEFNAVISCTLLSRWSNACKDTHITETTHKITKLTTNAELTFRVLAVNEAGPGEPSPATRFIRIAKSVAAEPPVVMEPLKDTSVGLGQPATLQCVISGTPPPEIKWYVFHSMFLILSIRV